MGIDQIAFVDSISATALTRLNLSVDPISVIFSGTSLPPPPLRRVLVQTLLQDGTIIPNAVYDNRTIVLHVQIRSASVTLAATMFQLLNRELDRSTNILKWQPDPNIPPIYFRTFRAPDYDQSVDHGLNLYDLTITIPAEPFAYGLREDIGSVTINGDPASTGSNGKFFELTGIKGDVETPLRLTIPGASVGGQSQTLFSTRRRGTPSQAPFLVQAESMTQGVDTSTTAAGSSYSPGTGTDASTTTFSTDASMRTRLTGVTHSGGTVDARGQYQVYARANCSASGAFSFQLSHSTRNAGLPINNSPTAIDLGFTATIMIDLGMVQLPEGFDPVQDGLSNIELPVAGVTFSVGATRTSGSGSVIFDYFLFVPADDRLCIVNWGDASTPTSWVLDAMNRTVYALDASGRIRDASYASFVGDLPSVSPNVTNRIVVIKDVNTASSDSITGTFTIQASYWPRYLYIRPVAS